MNKEPIKPISYLMPLLVLLALIGAFFLGSLHPFIPKQSTASEIEEMEGFQIYPQVDVWLSKDQLFVWNGEAPQPLEQLPARIRLFKTKHSLRFASVSGEDLTRYSEMVFALDELKKAGFRSITVETRTKPIPGLR